MNSSIRRPTIPLLWPPSQSDSLSGWGEYRCLFARQSLPSMLWWKASGRSRTNIDSMRGMVGLTPLWMEPQKHPWGGKSKWLVAHCYNKKNGTKMCGYHKCILQCKVHVHVHIYVPLQHNTVYMNMHMSIYVYVPISIPLSLPLCPLSLLFPLSFFHRSCPLCCFAPGQAMSLSSSSCSFSSSGSSSSSFSSESLMWKKTTYQC